MDRVSRGKAFNVLQYAIAGASLAWLFSAFDWRRLLELVTGISVEILLAVLVVSGLGTLPLAWMWSSLLGRFGRVAFGDVLRADLVIKFINGLLPSRVSGRLAAPVAVRYYTGFNWEIAAAATGAHTGLYAFCYAVASIAGLLVLLPHLSIWIQGILGLSTAVYTVVAVLVIAGGWYLDRMDPILDATSRGVARIPVIGRRLGSFAMKATPILGASAGPFRAIMKDRRALVTFGISWVMALAVLPGIRVFLLFIGFGFVPNAPLLLPLYLIAGYAVTILPLSPGGIGVAEVTSTLVFVELGFPPDIVISVIFLDRFLGAYLPAMVGWYPATKANFDQLLADSAEAHKS